MTAVAVSAAAIGRAPSAWRRLRESPALIAGLLLLAAIVIAVLVGPLLTGYSPDQQDTANILAGPSSAHWLGTDQLGRDVLTRLLYAGRTDLKVGILAVLFPFFFGTLIGTIAGYYGGLLDTVVMRIVDILVAFPFYVLIISLVFVVGPGTRGIYIAFAIVDWVVYARTVRSTTLVVRESDYVAAAKLGGLSDARILLRHVLPNTISQAIVYIMSDVVLVIVAIVTLGYLGLGVQPPTPDLGTMVASGANFLPDNWWESILPGFAILFVTLGFNLLGDGLRDLFDVEEVR